MERLQWIFELTDRMTGPARRITQSLDAVDRGLRTVNRSTNALQANQRHQAASTRFVGRAVARHNEAIDRAAGRYQALGSAAQSSLGGVSAGLASFAAGTARVVAATAALAGLATAAATARGAVDALAFRENALRGLETATGSATEAMRVYQRAIGLADELGRAPQETVRQIDRLMGAGFQERQAFGLTRMFADIQARNPAANVEGLTTALTQMRSKGVIAMEELRGQLLENAGGLIQMESLARRLQPVLNLPGQNLVREFEAAVSRGQVTADMIIPAVMGSVEERTGKALGEFARSASMGLGGQLERLSNAPQRMFLALADESTNAGQRITVLLTRLNELLHPTTASGQRILGGLVSALETGVTAIEKTGAAFAWLRTQARDFLDMIPPRALERITLGFKAIGVVIAGVGLFFGALAGIAAAGAIRFVESVGAMVEPFVRLGEWIDRVGVRLGLFIADMRLNGRQVIAGWLTGFLSGVTQAITAVGSFADRVTQRMRSALQIHSPSRVFMNLGEMTGAGFALGLERSMPGLDFGGVEGMGPTMGTSGPALGSLSAARAANVTITNNIEVQAVPGESSQDLAERIGEVIDRRMVQLFEGFTLETGTW